MNNSRKNVIYIIIDALSQNVLDDYPLKEKLFLHSLSRNSLVCTNLYSQASYTEACVNSYLCGQQSLDYSSCLFFGDKAPDNLNRFFERNGYDIYSSNCFGNNSPYYHDDSVSHSIFYIHLYRLNDLKNIYQKTGKLNEKEISFARLTLTKTIKDAIIFLEDIVNDHERLRLQRRFINKKDAIKAIDTYYSILSKLSNDDYLINIIARDFESVLPKMDVQTPFSNPARIRSLLDSYKKPLLNEINKHVIRKGKYKNIFVSSQLNTRNHFVRFLKSFKWSVSNLFRNRIKKEIASYLDVALTENRMATKDCFSLRTRIDDVISFIGKADSPFYVCIQPQDFHQSSNFFSYDVDDIDLIDNELKEALDTAKKIPKKIKANILSYLSLQYVDKQVKRWFDYLDQSGRLDDSIIVISADHGHWGYYKSFPKIDPVDIVDDTRIHVPLIIYGNEIQPQTSDKLLNTYSIPNTIVKFAGFNSNAFFMPSIFDIQEEKYIIAEYFNGGSPDIEQKPIHYIVHNDRYKLLIICNIQKDITFDKCICFYDLYKDKNESRNLLNKKRYHQLIEDMMSVAVKRHNELREHIFDYYIPPESWL